MQASKTRELIRDRLDLLSVIEDAGIELKKINGNEYRGKSPFGGENATKLRVIRKNTTYWTWNVFDKMAGEIGAGGDVVNFVEAYIFNGDKEKAFEYCMKKAGIHTHTKKESGKTFKQNKALSEKIINWKSNLDKYAVPLAYLYSRGVKKETIEKLSIGFNPYDFSLTIPFFYNDKPVNYTGRFIYTNYSINQEFIENPEDAEFKQTNEYKANPNRNYRKHKRAWNGDLDEATKDIPLGLNSLYEDTEKNDVILCEGTFDYLSAIQEGFKCVCSTGGAFTENQFTYLEHGLKHYLSESKKNHESSNIYLIFDNDEQGIKFSNKTLFQLIDAGIFNFYVVIPEKYKDINEYYVAENTLDNLLELKKHGLFYLAENYSNEDNPEALYEFFEKYGRFIHKMTLGKIFNQIRKADLFDDETLSEIENVANNKPRDMTIVEEIVDKYDVLYSDTLGFYKFNGTIWKTEKDRVIRKELIHKELGRKYIESGKVSTILELLKDEVILKDDDIFDKKRVRVFSNQGNNTLDLNNIDAGLRPAKSDDFCTIKLNYEYNPEAKCPIWLKFLYEVTGGDEQKMQLLQEFAGYILFPDNRLQVALYMIGEGGNGKSVFFNTIKKVIGLDRVSFVPLNKLYDNFSVIEMKGKDLNISSETGTKFTGSEEIFKQMVAGDEVMGGKKHKDNIFFESSTKFIMSANNMLKIEDKSEAIYRRLVFIDFPFKFVEKPKFKHEKLKDKDLSEKLENELSGIFNWIIEGYIRLLEKGDIIRTDEHYRLLKESKLSNNTVLQFIEECELNRLDSFLYQIDNTRNNPVITQTQFTVSDAFNDYQLFMNEQNDSGLNLKHFGTELKRILKDRYPQYEYKTLRITDHKGKTTRRRGYILNDEWIASMIDDLKKEKAEHEKKINEQAKLFQNNKKK